MNDYKNVVDNFQSSMDRAQIEFSNAYGQLKDSVNTCMYARQVYAESQINRINSSYSTCYVENS